MIRLTSCCLVALSLFACSSPAPERDTPAPTPLPKVSAQVGNADVAAATALKLAAIDQDPGRALVAINQATAAAPDRADLARLALQFCLNAQGCTAEPYESRLRKLDPANGVVWLSPLARSQAKKDSQAEQQILQALAKSERVDIYWNTLIWRLASALPPPAAAAGEPNLPLTTALNDVTLALADVGVPSFQSVTTACSPDRATDTTARTRCARIAQAMQRGDTALIEGIGLGIAQRLATPASPAAGAVDQRIAALAYQAEASGAVIRSQVERERFSAEMIELLRKLRREQDVQVAILRWAGQPLTNPNRWQIPR